MVREDGEIKAFGAGVLSSFAELAHMRSGRVDFQPFNPFLPQPKMRRVPLVLVYCQGACDVGGAGALAP